LSRRDLFPLDFDDFYVVLVNMVVPLLRQVRRHFFQELALLGAGCLDFDASILLAASVAEDRHEESEEAGLGFLPDATVLKMAFAPAWGAGVG